jgi:DNA polymerase-3 subunit alpha
VHEARASNQVSLFGEAGTDIPEPRLGGGDDWLPVDRLNAEHQAVGFYLSGHPLDDYQAALKRRDVMTLADLTRRAQGGALVAKIAGAVSARQERKSARGNRFAFVQLSDPTGLYEVTVFSETLEAARAHLEPGLNVVLTVEATMEGDTLKLLARSAAPIDTVVAGVGATGLRIHIAAEAAVTSVAGVLARVTGKPGSAPGGPITFCVTDTDAGCEYDIEIGARWPVTPQLKGAIKAVEGVLAVEDV